MPFFIPLMIGMTALSMIPSFIPHEEKRANEVIKQTGNNYYNRQTWRTGNPRGTNPNPYPEVKGNETSTFPIQKYILYGGLAVVALITIKFLLGRI